MNIKLFGPATLGLVALGASVSANAVPTTDVQDYSNNTATEYFVDNDGNKYNAPYYRDQYEDWGWTHGGIAGSGFSSITLDISAFDVDYTSWSPNYVGERDMIWVFDGASWLSLGDLNGSDNTWDFTTFDLTGYSWAEAQVNAGLQIKMDIDTLQEGWLVTLGKAVLSVDGGNQGCVPTPGIPCVTTPEPTILALLGLGLAGVGVARRKARK